MNTQTIRSSGQTPKVGPGSDRRQFLKEWGKRRIRSRRDMLAEVSRANLKVYGPGWIMPMWPLYVIAMRRGWTRERWYEFAYRAADVMRDATEAAVMARCDENWEQCDRNYCQRERECAERAASAPAERIAKATQS